jgi:cystathionine beta-lyase/cystathionine gamma-synthase
MERQLVTAKIPRDIVSAADRVADELGTTRSMLIAWSLERGVIDLGKRMKAAEEAGEKLPPGDPWKVGS